MRIKILSITILLFSLSSIINAQNNNVEGTWVYNSPDGSIAKIVFHSNSKYDFTTTCMYYGDNMGLLVNTGNWSITSNTVSLEHGKVNIQKSDTDVEKYCGGKTVPPHTLSLNGAKNELKTGARIYKRTSGGANTNTNNSSGNTSSGSVTKSTNTPPPAYAQTNLQQIKDKYIQTFNPDGYAAYSSGQSVKYQGLQMAKNLSNNLDSYGELIKTMDAEALLSDFNQQIQDINNLQAQYNQESNSYDFQTGQNIGNSINSGNYDAAISQFFGALDANEERKAAERKLQAKKDALYQQRRSQMSEIYWKAVAYNNEIKDQYLKAAAYSEFKKDENYNLAFVENLDCFNESMENNWSSAHSNWLVNNCPVPPKNNIAGIENTFVDKDVYYSNIAKRKFKYFQETEIPHYRDAAIAFAAKAVKTKPSAKYFLQMGNYYDGYSTVLALSNYSVADYYDPSFLNTEQKQRLEELKSEAEKEIKYALETNNQEFINAFINAKLNKLVRVDGKKLLTYAIALDQPDAVQIIIVLKQYNGLLNWECLPISQLMNLVLLMWQTTQWRLKHWMF